MVMPAETIFTDDDTQEMPALVLHTRRIDTKELRDLTQIEGSLCAYRLGGMGEWILGHITMVGVAKHNRIMVCFQPVPSKNAAYLPMWRPVEDVRYAWYGKAGE